MEDQKVTLNRWLNLSFGPNSVLIFWGFVALVVALVAITIGNKFFGYGTVGAVSVVGGGIVLVFGIAFGMGRWKFMKIPPPNNGGF